ncbi:Stk1 family PASTA domain-containing Ser/Thr kinase [Demetria terragena]|uniref:Stk1 family PASTA domain-containing Ser/Thr kinase n=1 Tax=Demetria terragena TaxID=63959 RepID=UPI000380F3BD
MLGGRYEVGELIGRGGMAEVHLGHDTRLGRQVAIKMLRSDLARDHTFLTRFRREAQSAAGLNHHAIVAVYDSGEDVFIETGGAQVDVPYIVMEFVDGKTLREILNEEGRLSPDEAARITQGVLAALEYSHDHGIVHRDIKPANVMVSRGGSVKVMDFGIARALADAGATMTSAQTVVGTARYLSPEQARGATVDERSDLYSAGCVLYELLTGRTPFVGEPVSLVYQHIQDQPELPSSHEASLPEAMDAITMHALEKDREKRYQSAAEFRTDLQDGRAGRGVSPAAVASLAAVGAASAAVLRRRSEPEPVAASDHTADMADAEEPRRRTALWALAGVVALAAILGIGYLLFQDQGDTETPAATVPAVVQQPQEEAERMIRDVGLVPNVEEVASSSVDQGNVISQNPEANSQVPEGSEVTLEVSTGPGDVSLPDVRGQSETQAIDALTARGFPEDQIRVANQPEDDTTYAKGEVASTNPAPGKRVALSQTVTLRLSSGKVTVPEDLTGKSRDEATVALSQLKLTADVQERTTDDSDQWGTVIEVPKAGDKVDLNSEVTVFVGERPDSTVTVSPPPTEPTETPSPSTEPSSEPSSTPPPPSSSTPPAPSPTSPKGKSTPPPQD